ncbi:hypothetical protein KCP75_12315 [Salmonella enterica subsp. enterica]|nr:hypothetical protein KCP75_12315 [Salmonella enterica subsp. enterica]
MIVRRPEMRLKLASIWRSDETVCRTRTPPGEGGGGAPAPDQESEA